MKNEIVKYILQFAEHNLDYLILRNYENLPDDEGHDIDFLINESELPKTQSLVHEIKVKFNTRIFKRQQYYGLCGYVIVIGDTILHLDFFTRIQWNRFNFILTKEALSRKKRYHDLWVISDEDLYYYCWVLYIRVGGHIKEKYRINAFKWEDELNQNMTINIRTLSPKKNKQNLIKHLIKETTIRKTIANTFANIAFKIWKLSSMDGRIYVLDNMDVSKIETLRKYCSCNRYDIVTSKDISFFPLLRMLYQEYSIGITPSVWITLWWRRLIPSTYIITNVVDLGDAVREIYRGVEL